MPRRPVVRVLYDQANTYLRENKLEKYAATLKAKTQQARQTAARH
jgi:hypothetical protein